MPYDDQVPDIAQSQHNPEPDDMDYPTAIPRRPGAPIRLYRCDPSGPPPPGGTPWIQPDGRLKVPDEAVAQALADAAIAYMDTHPACMTIDEIAVHLRAYRLFLLQAEQKWYPMAHAMGTIRSVITARLAGNGLFGVTVPSITAFALKQYGWSEKSEVNHEVSGQVDVSFDRALAALHVAMGTPRPALSVVEQAQIEHDMGADGHDSELSTGQVIDITTS